MSAVRSCYRPPKRRPHVICSMGSFFLPFSFFLYGHVTSCIRDSLHFAPRFAPSKCVRCGTSSILLSPTKKKASCASRRDAFFLTLSLPPYLSFNLLHPRSRSFARRFAPSNDVRCGTSSILLSPTIMKTSCDLLHAVFFLAFFLFSLRSCNLLHPRLTTFCASLRSFKMCSLRNQFDPAIAHHTEKSHMLRAVGFFIAISLLPHLSFPLPLKNLLHLTPQRGIIRKHMGH